MSSNANALLKPRGAGAVVADTFRLFRANLGPVLLSIVIASLVAMIMEGLMPVLIERLDVADDLQTAQKLQFGVFGGMKPEDMQRMAQELDQRSIRLLQLYAGAIGVAQAAFGLLLSAALIWVLADWALLGKARTAQAWDFALGKLGALVGAAISGMVVLVIAAVVGVVGAGLAAMVIGLALKGAMPGGGLAAIALSSAALFMIPMAIAGTYLACLVPAAVVEQQGMFGSVARSFALVSGRFWRTFGTLLLLVIIGLGPAGVLAGLGQQFMASLTDSLGTLVAGVILTVPKYVLTFALGPLLYLGSILIYFSLRQEKDPGYNLQILASELEHETMARITTEPQEEVSPVSPGPLPPGLSGAQRDDSVQPPSGP